MKLLCPLAVMAVIALAASCRLDKLFNAGRNTPLSHDKPVDLVFTTEPAPAHAGQPLDLVSVAVVDSSGTPVAGADSLITVALGDSPGSATSSGATGHQTRSR